MPILRFKPSIGGGEEHVYQIAKRLISRGHDVVVYTSDLLHTFPRYVYLQRETSEIGNIQVRSFHAVRLLHNYPVLPALGTTMMKEKADVIHAHGYGYFTSDISSMISYLRRIPLVLTTHGFFPVTTPANRFLTHVYLKFSQKNLLKVARKVICVSTADAEYYAQLTDPDRLAVIPNGIDMDSWRRLPRKSSFRTKHSISGPLIMAVGRITWAKGFQKLIQASSFILKEFHDAVVVIAGEDFGYLNNLKQIAKRLNVYDSVIFAGPQSDQKLKELYVDADVVVIPSLYEPFGIVALEAMACGKPIVVSCRGGLAEIVRHEENGLLVDPKDPKKLANAIIKVLQDQVLVKKMRYRNKAEVMKYSWDNIVTNIEDIYYRAIQLCRK